MSTFPISQLSAISIPDVLEVFACPGCDASCPEQRGKLAAPADSRLNGEVFTQPAYFLYRCGDCGLYYKSHVVGDTTLGSYYASTDFRKWEIQGIFPTEKIALKQLRRTARGGRILDFGCSSGRLLARMTRDYECLGYEINQVAAQVAARKGIRMLADPFDMAERSLDALVMVDVFEHLRQPTRVISELARLVKPGGTMTIVTGNADAPIAREYEENFWYLRTLEHLTMLSRSYAEYLAARIDADITDWEEVSHYRWNPGDQLFQSLRRFSYRSWHGPIRPFGARFATFLPLFRRAKNWTELPSFTCGSDHVVAQFRISSGRT